MPSAVSGQDPLEIAKKMVEKKISIKVDGANNQLTLVVGDFVNIDELEENLET